MSKEIRNLGIVLCLVLLVSFLIYKFVAPSAAVQNSTQISSQIGSQINSPSPMAAGTPMVSNVSTAHSFSYGPAEAKVTVVEFFDPECESCAKVAPYIKKEMMHYEGRVRWIFRYMPYHFNSKTAIKVLEAARKQNLFLEVLNVLFEKQSLWGEQRVSTEKIILEVIASVKGLDIERLKKDMHDPEFEKIINLDEADGQRAGVRGTPTFFVNGVILEPLDLDNLLKRINEQL